MPRLLAVAPYPMRSADTRYRIGQFVPHLEAAGWLVRVRPLMDERLFAIYNQPGHAAEKAARTLAGLARRVGDLLRGGPYDAVLLHKEAFPFGPPLIERLLRRAAPRLIYDMDDAFWSHPPQFRQIGARLRDPNRIAKMIALSDQVLAGNEFLAAYARRFNPRVTLFPTVLDTARYLPRAEPPDGVVTIGWVGRWSSSDYLAALVPVFERLAQRCPAVQVRVVGAERLPFPASFRWEAVPWRLEREIEDIAGFDIGIMPLPDDEYSRGKCGFKLLQYMALGIPGVASPVGVNREIIADGVNGLLASGPDEWLEKLTALVEDAALRRSLGLAGRRTVEERYSLAKAVPRLLAALEGTSPG